MGATACHGRRDPDPVRRAGGGLASRLASATIYRRDPRGNDANLPVLTTSKSTVDFLIGIDDTDNLESRGTGFHARCLVQALEHAGVATAVGVTRHQLFFDDRIPYTSHNSSACISVSSRAPDVELFSFCRTHMLDNAIDGSDIGLCLATPEQAATVVDYARRAKCDVLDQQLARTTAAAADIALEGLSGTRDGIIGALASVGLFADGNDGRYIWKPRLRELRGATMCVRDLLEETGIDDIRLSDGVSIVENAEARIALGDWARPVRIAGHSVLLVQKGNTHESAEYKCIDKQRIKEFRP